MEILTGSCLIARDLVDGRKNNAFVLPPVHDLTRCLFWLRHIAAVKEPYGLLIGFLNVFRDFGIQAFDHDLRLFFVRQIRIIVGLEDQQRGSEITPYGVVPAGNRQKRRKRADHLICEVYFATRFSDFFRSSRQASLIMGVIASMKFMKIG